MIVAGAKGLAKELLDIFARRQQLSNLYFFDNVSPDAPDHLFGQFKILRTFDQVEDTFKKLGDFSFALGLGNPVLRQILANQFLKIGGVLTSVICPDEGIAPDLTVYSNVGAGGKLYKILQYAIMRVGNSKSKQAHR